MQEVKTDGMRGVSYEVNPPPNRGFLAVLPEPDYQGVTFFRDRGFWYGTDPPAAGPCARS
jgi:hypothetical protein